MKVDRITEEEYAELKATHAGILISALEKERRASAEFLHRWHAVADLLDGAKCPSDCASNKCTWCYEKDRELSAFESYKRSG